MKNAVLMTAMGAFAAVAATSANAQEAVGRVISSTPVVQQVAVPRQVCSQQPVAQSGGSGGGAVVGAIVGGLLGNTVGGGMGRIAATGLGMVGGAAIGDRIEANGNPQYAQGCTTQTTYENRTVAYNVQYEYNGQQHTVQMPYDPGQQVRLQVSPVGAGQVAQAPMQGVQQVASGQPQATIIAETTQYGQPVYQGQPVYTQPVYAQPVYAYPAYGYPVYRPYVAPISFSLGLGYYGGWRGGHHWR